MTKIKKALEGDNSLYIVEIDGKEIQSQNDYLEAVSEKFCFPFTSTNLNSYEDWITDLVWLHKEGYVLIIYNFKHFLKEDLYTKRQFIEGFEEIILPFWEKDIEQCVVEGKP